MKLKLIELLIAIYMFFFGIALDGDLPLDPADHQISNRGLAWRAPNEHRVVLLRIVPAFQERIVLVAQQNVLSRAIAWTSGGRAPLEVRRRRVPHASVPFTHRPVNSPTDRSTAGTRPSLNSRYPPFPTRPRHSLSCSKGSPRSRRGVSLRRGVHGEDDQVAEASRLSSPVGNARRLKAGRVRQCSDENARQNPLAISAAR